MTKPRGKYVPATFGLEADFFARAASGELHLQRCAECGRFRHPPTYRCAGCGCGDWEWAPSPGRGNLFSWTVSYRPYDTGWVDDAPWVTAVVELDEGPRLVGWLRDVDPESLALGDRIVVHPEPVDDGFTFLRFSPEG